MKSDLRPALLAIVALSVLTPFSHSSFASAIAVDNYTQLADRMFVDVPASNNLVPRTLGSVVITASPTLVTGSFASWPTDGPDNPGNGNGYFADNDPTVSFRVTSVTLNFSSSLAAFGATFMHFEPGRAYGEDFPAMISAYSAPNGGGTLIGQATSSGWLSGAGTPDFVAVWSDAVNIQSVVLRGTGVRLGFAVDTYGGTLTPLPEPEAAVFIGVAYLTSRRRSHRRR